MGVGAVTGGDTDGMVSAAELGAGGLGGIGGWGCWALAAVPVNPAQSEADAEQLHTMNFRMGATLVPASH